MTLYAKWEPVDHADYKVVVWKQRVTDSKNAVDSEKQYDYYDYRMIENTSTGTIILDSDEFKALGFENLTESSDSEIRDDFNFFHYSRTTVDVGRNTYNGSNPAERVQGVVAPDSSTVVNIYYDRDLMAINFYYSSNAPSGSSTAFTYTETDAVNTNTTYYGLTPNGYQALIRESTPNEYYTYTYRYSPTSAANQNNMYGVVNDEYVLLSSRSIYVWTPQYVYTPVNKATYSSNGYAVYNGEYVTAYYNNGGWYRTRSLSWFTCTYSDPVDGDVFSREDGSEFYTGTRYTRSGSRAPYTYTATTATNNTQYMVDSYGGHIQLTRSSSYAYSYNNADYTGQRYTRTTNSDNSLIYEGTLYKKVNGTMVEIAEGESYTGTVYGRDSDSHYEELTRRTEAAYTWKLSDGTVYTGPRYTRASKTGSMLTWTGLFGQTFAQNGYNWSTVSGYAWTGVGADGKSTTQTLLDSFSEAVNPYNLTQGSSTGNHIIYHYKQKIDGTYDTNNRYQANYSSNSTTFNFTNKFTGFTVAGYSAEFNANFKPDQLGAGEHAVEPKDSTTLTGNTIHIYHTRDTKTLTLTNFRTYNNSPTLPNDKDIEGIKYEQRLSEAVAAEELVPPDRENYTFDGWYYDKAFTKAVNFDEAYMPNGNLKIFAKWVLKYYFVEIDPDGGEMEDQLEFSDFTGFDSPRKQSTYTWVQFGNKISSYDNIERNYVPDPNGDYRYVNVKFAENFESAAAKSWDYSLPAKYRAAFYCKGPELEQVYNNHFRNLVDKNGEQLITWDFFRTKCVDQSKLYRPAEGVEHYVLSAWYKVNDDGTTSHDIYNFNDTVTKPTRIRAVWRKSGHYSIEYDPYMRRYDVGRYVESDGVMHENTKHYDPPLHDEVTMYTDDADTTIYTAPLYNPDDYIFRGWQLLDSRGNETGEYYNPSAEFKIDSKYADDHGVIHFEAAYEPRKESVRRTDIAALTLDANSEEQYGGYVVKNGLDVYEDYTYVDLQQNQLYFKKQPNNFSVSLQDYYNNFRNRKGYMLIGWDEQKEAANFIPKYSADAVIGVDSKQPESNVLYAIWEPLYYFNLENHSKEFDVTFNLRFNDFTGVVYSSETNEVVTVFERDIFGDLNNDSITVSKRADGTFDVTLKKASPGSDINSIKLVLPRGEGASYVVSGSIAGTDIVANHKTLTVFNSGGANASANSYTTSFSVSGSIIHSETGQTVAFYTEDPPHTNINLKAYYYDPTGGWTLDSDPDDSVGPNATLAFEDLPSNVTVDQTTNSITLYIISEHPQTFSVNETYARTDKYKFIGWFARSGATPRDLSIDGREFGNAKVTGLNETNDPEKTYYALYVPYSDGTLSLSHDESQTSIGYPKKMYIQADYTYNGAPVSQEAEVTTMIEPAVAITHTKVHTQIDFVDFKEPRTAAESETPFTINLKTMSGYGCVHYNTYEEGRAFPRNERIEDEATIIDVHIDPYDESSPSETKHYYGYELHRTVGDMFEDSEAVKGYKTIKNIRFYSDFERKYEFIYEYTFRDGTTTRKYQVKDATAYLKSEDNFKQFVFESAPYISNFGEEFVWKPDIVVENLIGKGQVTATMKAVQTKAATAYVTVKRFDASIPWAIDVGTAFPKDNCPVAELIINGKQFRRWKIEDTETNKLLGYWYNPEFTSVVWSNYTITPEYVDMTGDEYEYIPPDETESYITLDYLDSTRNQWVGLDAEGNIIVDAKGVATEHYDSLISDFSILFTDKNNRINTDPEHYKVGLIFEVVGQIENTDIPDQYTAVPNDALRTKAIAAVVNSSSESGSIKSGGQVKFYYSQIDPSALSDANRI